MDKDRIEFNEKETNNSPALDTTHPDTLPERNELYIKFLIDADGCIFGEDYKKSYSLATTEQQLTTEALRQQFIMQEKIVSKGNPQFFSKIVKIIQEKSPKHISFGVGSNRQSFHGDFTNRKTANYKGLFFPALYELKETLDQQLQQLQYTTVSTVDPILLADIFPVAAEEKHVRFAQKFSTELQQLNAQNVFGEFNFNNSHSLTILDSNKINIIYLHAHRTKLEMSNVNPNAIFTMYFIDDTIDILTNAQRFYEFSNGTLLPIGTVLHFIHYNGQTWRELGCIHGTGPLDQHYQKNILALMRLAEGGAIFNKEVMLDIAVNLMNKKYHYGINDFINYRTLMAQQRLDPIELTADDAVLQSLFQHMISAKNQENIIAVLQEQLSKNKYFLEKTEESLQNNFLLIAAARNQARVVEWLMKKGCNTEHRNRLGYAAIDMITDTTLKEMLSVETLYFSTSHNTPKPAQTHPEALRHDDSYATNSDSEDTPPIDADISDDTAAQQNDNNPEVGYIPDGFQASASRPRPASALSTTSAQELFVKGDRYKRNFSTMSQPTPEATNDTSPATATAHFQPLFSANKKPRVTIEATPATATTTATTPAATASTPNVSENTFS